jgi:hypothetical protein
MSGLFFHKEPENAERLYAPLGNSETFDIYDPVQFTSQQLSDSAAAADAELTDGDIVGFACEPAEGIHSGTRTSVNAGDGFGAIENDWRTYFPFDAPGLQLRTRNFWADGDSTTDVAKDGTLIGTVLGMIVNASGAYGLENALPGDATDAQFFVVAVLDNNMQPINADATQTAGDGWLVFRPVAADSSQIGDGVGGV